MSLSFEDHNDGPESLLLKLHKNLIAISLLVLEKVFELILPY